MRTWHISAVSGLACEQKEKTQQQQQQKKRQKQKEKKRQQRNKSALRRIVWLFVCFFQMDGFFSLFTLLQVNYADMVHA